MSYLSLLPDITMPHIHYLEYKSLTLKYHQENDMNELA
ncbi:hypothetical protein HDF23_001680 [Mucilaginibacter lappiensis]|uniref:Uncharacterized protein n=1 Tax=Mucilaginibacter lappiensis TaxID=354630 RepID=A0ABR6PGS1_9SPHI|nr:hypothetical protein [Mucilaginibacter lappiensis]